MPRATPSQIEELKARHGSIYELEGADEIIYVRRPSRAEYSRFRDQIFDENRRARASEQLLLSVVVYPDQAALNSMLDEKPGLVETFGGEVMEIAGAAKDSTSKKL